MGLLQRLRFSRCRLQASGVDGWLTAAERRFLFRAATRVESGTCIVELGVWHGLSTIYLAGGSAAGNRAPVYSVDRFVASGSAAPVLAAHHGHGADWDYGETFARNVRAARRAVQITPVRADTAAAGRVWDGPPIGLLFVDADHSLEGVRRDWNAWRNHIAPKGTVAFHDYSNSEYEVAEFVDDLVASGILQRQQQHGSILATKPVAR